MEEIISRVAQAAGIDEGLASKALSIILSFLNKEGPSDAVSQLMGALPGAQDMIEGGDGGGGLGGLMGSIGGGMGAMGAMQELTSAGLDMGQVQSAAREFLSAAKEKAGDEVVDRITGEIPMLDQIL
ncbi:MAG: DUF2267 domain-containing protein [Pseudomonadota bacterium]